MPRDHPLYLIEILHQTTTIILAASGSRSCILSKFYIKPQLFTSDRYPSRSCILSKFYIKPQPFHGRDAIHDSCILSKFYIKPQRLSGTSRFIWVVSYRNSTSNHNTTIIISLGGALYLIEILHQTTTFRKPSRLLARCILSKFYIKPQLVVGITLLTA